MYGATHKTKYGNCLLQNYDVNIKLLPYNTHNATDEINNDFELEDSDLSSYFESSSLYKSNVLNYISGFIQRKILKHELCTECKKFFNEGESITTPFLDLRNEGGLVKPNGKLNEVVIICENVLQDFISKTNIYTEKNVIEKIYQCSLKIIDVKKPSFLHVLNTHPQCFNSIGTHRNIFIRKIVNCYVTLKLKHLSKMKNQSLHKKKIRHQFNKLVLFKNQ